MADVDMMDAMPDGDPVALMEALSQTIGQKGGAGGGGAGGGSPIVQLWYVGRAALGRDRHRALGMMREGAEKLCRGGPVPELAVYMGAVSSCHEGEGEGGEENVAILGEIVAGANKKDALPAICSLALLGESHTALAACEGVLRAGRGGGGGDDDGGMEQVAEAIWSRLMTDHVSFALPDGKHPLRKLMGSCKGLAVILLPLCVRSLRDSPIEAVRAELGLVVSKWLSEDPMSLSRAGGVGGAGRRMLVGVCVGWKESGNELRVGDTLHASLLGALASGDGPGESLPVRAVEVSNAVQAIGAMDDPAHRSKAADRLGQILLAGASRGKTDFTFAEVSGCLGALPSSSYVDALLEHLPTILKPKA